MCNLKNIKCKNNSVILERYLSETKVDYALLLNAVKDFQEQGETAENAKWLITVSIGHEVDRVLHGYDESTREQDKDFIVAKFWQFHSLKNLDMSNEERLRKSFEAVCQNLRKKAYGFRMREKRCDASCCGLVFSDFTEDVDGYKEPWEESRSGSDFDTAIAVIKESRWHERGAQGAPASNLDNAESANMLAEIWTECNSRGVFAISVVLAAINSYFSHTTSSGHETSRWMKALAGSMPEELKEQFHEETGIVLPDGNEAMRREFRRLKFMEVSSRRIHHLRKPRAKSTE